MGYNLIGTNWRVQNELHEGKFMFTLYNKTTAAPAQLWEMRKALSLVLSITPEAIGKEEATMFRVIADDLAEWISWWENKGVRKLQEQRELNRILHLQLTDASLALKKWEKSTKMWQKLYWIALALCLSLIGTIRLFTFK